MADNKKILIKCGWLVTLDDKQGTFGTDGHWISGELRECDPQLCGWVSGPLVANHRVGTTSGPAD